MFQFLRVLTEKDTRCVGLHGPTWRTAWLSRVALFVFGIATLCLIAVGPAACADAPGKTWGEPLIKEPFDKSPFRPVEIPAWLEDVTAYIFSSPEEAVEFKAQMAPLGIGGIDYVYYPSKLLPMAPGTDPNEMQKKVDAFKKAGIRCIAAIPPRIMMDPYAKHPEWRSKKTRDEVTPEISPENPYGGYLCMMGPWGDYLIDVLDEAMTMYPGIVGYSFDGIHDSGACYCDNCRNAYKKEVGADIPDVNLDDPAFRKYQHWLDRRIENFCFKLQNRLKAKNPDFALVTWTTNAGRFGHFLSIPRNMPARMNLLFDSPGQEFWLDETNRGNTVVPAFANAYIWAVSNHRHAHSEPYLMSHGNPYSTDSFPPHELIRRVMLTITWGAQVGLATGWTNLHDTCKQALLEVDKRKAWLTHKQAEPWAAMVMSDNTNNFYGRDPEKDEERYLSNVLGTFRATMEEHLPTLVVNDWNLTLDFLKPYKVLVLPNTACISEQQAAVIRQYVKNGGGLVASVDASLFDEMGNPRKDFLLSDVFGVHYRGMITGAGGVATDLDPNFAMGVDASYWEKRKNIFDFMQGTHPIFDTPRLKQYIGGKAVTFKGQAAGVSVDADRQTIGMMTSREAGSKAMPAIVIGQYGKGRVAYLAAGFDSAYYLYPYPYQRLLVTEAMKWAASAPPTISVDAPMCVHFTTYRQKKDGERLVVHLYNDLNTAGNHAKPDDDTPLREESIPISGIKVRFKGYKITSFHLEPQGTTLKARKTADGMEVTVPKLDVHTMVIAELGK
ncbi:MAG: hypothetical protein WCL39_00655 [Armatimonadota bacterium]